MSIVKTFVTVVVQYINSTLEISHCVIINVILLSLFMRIFVYYPEIGYDCFKICSLLEFDALLGYYAAYSGNSLPIFRKSLSAQSSRVKKSKKKAIDPCR
jgi:hypothetical protein